MSAALNLIPNLAPTLDATRAEQNSRWVLADPALVTCIDHNIFDMETPISGDQLARTRTNVQNVLGPLSASRARTALERATVRSTRTNIWHMPGVQAA